MTLSDQEIQKLQLGLKGNVNMNYISQRIIGMNLKGEFSTSRIVCKRPTRKKTASTTKAWQNSKKKKEKPNVLIFL